MNYIIENVRIYDC